MIAFWATRGRLQGGPIRRGFGNGDDPKRKWKSFMVKEIPETGNKIQGDSRTTSGRRGPIPGIFGNGNDPKL